MTIEQGVTDERLNRLAKYCLVFMAFVIAPFFWGRDDGSDGFWIALSAPLSLALIFAVIGWRIGKDEGPLPPDERRSFWIAYLRWTAVYFAIGPGWWALGLLSRQYF